MIPFVVMFLLAGAALVVGGRKMERQANQAANWKVTDGHLEQCEVVEIPATAIEEPSSWRLKIEYSYVVCGVTYRSNRYAFGYGDSIDDQKHRMAADTLQRSPRLSVRYDPAHPSEAVLSTAAPTGVTAVGYLLLVLAGISALIAWAGR